MQAYTLEPPLDDQISLYARAWHDLSTTRPIGMVVGMIPWTAIVAWCDFHGLDREATQLVIDVIQYLDNDRARAEASERALKNARGE